MKKTITILTTLLVMLVVEVHASQLFLRTNSARAEAQISGQRYFSSNGEIIVSQLRPGRHFISVTERQGRRGPQGRSYGNQNQRYRNHTSYGRQGNRGFNLFSGKIFIPQNSNVFATITPRGRLIIDKIVPQRGNRPYHRKGNGRDYGNNGGNRGNGRDNDQWENDSRDGRHQNGNRGRSNFSSALNTIRDASFESQKKIIAKQYLNSNDVTSQEVLELIKAFDFESSRLEIAKYAFDKTVDQNNYFVVNQGFDFPSSANALNRFIS